MNIEYRQGDLFAQPDLKAIAHGVNCQGAMGKGIALQFKARWPDMYQEYATRCQLGALKVGDVFVWETPELTVYNLATQPDWRHSATLDNIRKCTERMAFIAKRDGITRVGVPRIGAGLGGLAWIAVALEWEKAHGPGVTLVVVTP